MTKHPKSRGIDTVVAKGGLTTRGKQTRVGKGIDGVILGRCPGEGHTITETII